MMLRGAGRWLTVWAVMGQLLGRQDGSVWGFVHGVMQWVY
jgi:hypothetical protein